MTESAERPAVEAFNPAMLGTFMEMTVAMAHAVKLDPRDFLMGLRLLADTAAPTVAKFEAAIAGMIASPESEAGK